MPGHAAHGSVVSIHPPFGKPVQDRATRVALACRTLGAAFCPFPPTRMDAIRSTRSFAPTSLLHRWLHQAREGVAASYTPPVEHPSRSKRYHVGWLFDVGVVACTILFGVLWLSA